MISDLELLTNGEIEIEGRLVDASNATLLVTLTLGEHRIRAIYKPRSGERPLWDFAEGTLGLRERAAFLLSELAGFDLVPLTILRDGPFGFGSIQLWIDLDESINLSEYYRSNEPQLRSAVIFDALANNTDRKIGHLLPRSDGKLFLCDHGVTFHVDDKLRTVLWQWAGQELSESEISQLRSLREQLVSDTESELRDLLNVDEFLALIGRCESLIYNGTFPLPNPEWPSIPWPPF